LKCFGRFGRPILARLGCFFRVLKMLRRYLLAVSDPRRSTHTNYLTDLLKSGSNFRSREKGKFSTSRLSVNNPDAPGWPLRRPSPLGGAHYTRRLAGVKYLFRPLEAGDLATCFVSPLHLGDCPKEGRILRAAVPRSRTSSTPGAALLPSTPTIVSVW